MVLALRSRILRCTRCGNYTLKETCPGCKVPTSNSFPPRYSPEDRYGKYRRMCYLESDNSKDTDREE